MHHHRRDSVAHQTESIHHSTADTSTRNETADDVLLVPRHKLLYLLRLLAQAYARKQTRHLRVALDYVEGLVVAK